MRNHEIFFVKRIVRQDDPEERKAAFIRKEYRNAVREHYRRVSRGENGLPDVERVLSRFDPEVRSEYDELFTYLYKNEFRTVVSASLTFHLSTSSVYRRLEKLCALIAAEKRGETARIGTAVP